MATEDKASPQWRFWGELRLIGRTGVKVWEMIPHRRKWAFVLAGVFMALGSFTAIGLPIALGHMIDGLRAGGSQDDLIRTTAYSLGLFAGLILVRECLQLARRYTVETNCTYIEKQMSVRIISHLLKVEMAFFTHEKVGSLHGRIFRGVDGYMRFLKASFLDFFPAFFTGFVALVYIFVKAPWLALIMACVVPISVTLTAWQLLSQKGVRLLLNHNREDLDGNIVELLGGLDFVRVADTHAQEVERVAGYAERRRAGELKHHIEMAFFGVAKAISEGFFYLCVLAFSAYMVVQGQATVGDIFIFAALFMSVMAPMAEIHRILDEGHEAALRVGDLMELLALPTDQSYEVAPKPVLAAGAGFPMIDVDGLRFSYRTSEGKIVRALEGVHLRIQEGETVGIVGRSGCGKSTLMKVLMRLIHPDMGRVAIRGVPIDAVSRAEISQLIGYVGQTPFIFSGSIEQNIVYGCPGVHSPEDIRRAARRACIHDEISVMPEGYATQLAERGANISGGQRQRIALARIFLKDPPILILDEATSALDTISERIVQRAIDEARADRTVIIVAHRLSTLSDADRILVFDGGRLVEEGPYRELVERGGIFAGLASHAPFSPPTPATVQSTSAADPNRAREEPLATSV